MATYFHGRSEFEADGMQTLYLMSPNYVPYSSADPHQPATATNMFFLNPAGNALQPTSFTHAPPSNHNHFLGLPLPSPTPSNSDDPNRPSPLFSCVHHNLWGGSSNIDHQQNSPQGSSNSNPQVVSAAAIATADYSAGPHPQDVESQLGFRRLGVSPRQGLSLSLSSQQVPYRSSNVEIVTHGQPDEVPPTTSLAADAMRLSWSSPSTVTVVSNGVSGGQSAVFGSKYLRAAQELLDEVVNVGKARKGVRTDLSEGTREKRKVNKESMVTGEGSSAGENGDIPGPELTTAQRQELQMKKAKLISMLDEVEQRHRQYHHQMQTVVVSFEQAAGFGAARSYTALTLQTISKQFRRLKDAISGQIKATSKSLGEEDCLGAKIEGSRLRYVDHQLRQQRTLQQLGMIQHNNAWRPQRGLPERAVCVLRSWLFEHFLHPYPKDADKHKLARQTGLTRSQVSNWFINARVRIWKPMVEEMYTEEVKGQQDRINGKEEEINNANKSYPQKESGSSSSSDQQSKHNYTSPLDQFNLIGSSDLAAAVPRSPKRTRNDVQPVGILPMKMDKKASKTREINMIFGDDQRLFKDSYSYLSGSVYGSIREMGRFDDDQQRLPPGFHGNGGVSLTLDLPHGENFVVSNQNINGLGAGEIQSDLIGIHSTKQASHSSTYDNIEMQNRKRFAAPLLPDFVA